MIDDTTNFVDSHVNPAIVTVRYQDKTAGIMYIFS